MKDLTSLFTNGGNQGNSWFPNPAAALVNPLYITGIKGNNPTVGANLEAAAIEQRNHEQAQRQQAEFARQQYITNNLPKIVNEIDWNNPQVAQSQLASIGLTPQEMIPLFNIFAGGEELGLKREELGLKKQEAGFRAAEHALRVKELEQRLAGELAPEERQKTETELRKELSGLNQTKDFQIVKTAYEKVKEIEKNPSAANDVALVFSLMKLYDPNSVVRESEYATAQNAAGVPDRIRSKWNQVLTGESLAPKQRADFLKSAKGQYKAQAKAYKPTAEKFEKLAQEYKVNPENVLIERPEIEEEPINLNQIRANTTKEAVLAEIARRKK